MERLRDAWRPDGASGGGLVDEVLGARAAELDLFDRNVAAKLGQIRVVEYDRGNPSRFTRFLVIGDIRRGGPAYDGRVCAPK